MFPPGLLEKDQNRNEHQEHAQRRQAKHVLDAHPRVDPTGQKRTKKAANINQRVIDRVPDGADVFARGPRRRPYHAGLD